VTRADVGPKLAQLNEFFVSHAATFTQVAALTALREGEELARMVDELRAKRDLCPRRTAYPGRDGAGP
jgi:hypothetical protein